MTLTPEQGQPLGLLWQTMWHREPLAKPPENETPEQKKQRQREARRAARQRPFEAKESYRWVEALEQGTKRVKGSTKVIHIFDREGDITEVFEKVRHLERTGALVRATHDRKLDAQSNHLWSKLEAQPIAFHQELG